MPAIDVPPNFITMRAMDLRRAEGFEKDVGQKDAS